MRVLVFFDLPMINPKDRKEYSQFRKFLIKSGFVMMQESVYSKIALNSTTAAIIMSNIRSHKPEKGLVQLLVVTEVQFSRIEYIIGENKSDTISDDRRLVIL